MSLKVEIDSYDYKEAIKEVQKLLDKIKASYDDEKEEITFTGIPEAEEIVDIVWDKIV